MKKILILIAIIMATVGVYLSYGILQAITVFVLDNPVWILIVSLSVGVQLIGHLFRAKRTKLVIDQATPSSLRFQFSTLSVGYLFNALLPLRLGELIRALLIARRLQISFLYTFVAIVIERSTDILFLSVLVVFGALLIGGQIAVNLIVVAVIAAAVATSFLVVLLLLKSENQTLLSAVSSLSRFFNTAISNSIRFKVWSLIYGLQSFFNNTELVRKYITYAAISWVCYFASAFIIVVPLLKLTNVLQIIITGISPYIISLPSLNPLDASSYSQLATLLPIQITSTNLDLFAKIIWAVLVLPMALIGIVSLVLYRVTNKGAVRPRPDSYTNKLLRNQDISQDFPAFLDTYFKGNTLSKILHKIEVHGELSLVKFFKGGSDAITVLALKEGKLFVKKIVPTEHAASLKVQYNWLKKFNDKAAIVNVLSEQTTEDYYAIDLSYDPENISLFEYIHTHSLKQSKQALDDVWSYVFENIYSLQPEVEHIAERDEYVQDRLLNKIKKATMLNEDLKAITKDEKIKINGEVYDNFYTIIDKIRNNKRAWGDIATYRSSRAIHGDLTIDNILIDTRTNKPFIIDPSDDNQIRGPILDFGRQTQSLAAGYEFLNTDEDPTKLQRKDGLVVINYHDRRSARYMQLCDYLDHTIAVKYLTDVERRTTLFHAGLLYGRMLTHRVVINPHNTLKYYAVSVILLNRFYEQYT